MNFNITQMLVTLTTEKSNVTIKKERKEESIYEYVLI